MAEENKEKILAIGKGFNLTDEDSKALYYFGQEIKPEAPKTSGTKKKASKITTNELDVFKEVLRSDFADKEITNKMIAPRMAVELGLNAKQTPSRLKALETEGFLVHIEGTKPKAYKIV